MTLTEVAVGIAIAVGLLGVVVPILPGSLLVLAAIVVWAMEVGGATAWSVAAVAAVVIGLGTLVKYVVPGRRLQESGIPASTQWAAVLAAIIGFFVIPVVGVLVGFVAGIYLAERVRLGGALAWPSTRAALRAVGLSILIEFAAASLAAATWAVGVVAT